ncbi:TVG0542920 [Thermoplasma volcanium GSS1]|uniref:TVG0542920 protein n=2 Tax=Thermoplasma volcanium TaxID=50339 RepID=Q97BA4_THEVO|nr:TVG0542920 [Thermoplasma volcanium GSS1]
MYAEQSHRKIMAIDQALYRRVREVIKELQVEADQQLKKQDIQEYMKTTRLIETIKSDFRSFFQRRYEKIVSKAIYDINSEIISVLTEEERGFIEKIHNLIMSEYDSFLPTLKDIAVEENQDQTTTTEVEKPMVISEPSNPTSQEKPIKDQAQTEKKEIEKKDVLVMITQDLPPIAQADRNYILHANDLVYLSEDIARILEKRNSAIILDH